MFESFIMGVTAVATPGPLLMLVIGVALGIVVGCIPGFSATMALVLALPFTFGMESLDGICLMLGIMTGGMSGGLISAMLLGIPGTAAAVATTFDGFPMAEKGQPGRALAVGTWASCLGGVLGGLLLVFCMPLLADVALSFGPWEYFSMVFFGLTIIASLAGKSLLKGLAAGVLGLAIACVGPDPMEGTVRFGMGFTELGGGFNYLAILIGLFSYPQLLSAIEGSQSGKQAMKLVRDISYNTREVVKDIMVRNPHVLALASFIGAFFGALPGVGAASATFVSYDQCKKISREREKFGTGVVPGILASESANNALAGGALIPALALGIPGDAMTAVMLGALVLHGLQPGPMLVFDQPVLVYGILAAFMLSNFVMLALQLWGVRIFVYITRVPVAYLLPVIIVLGGIGGFALQNRAFDIWVVYVSGLIGYLLVKTGFPLAPIILGAILGPIAETNFRRALLTESDPMLFLTRPISGVFLALSILSMAYPVYKHVRTMMSQKEREEAIRRATIEPEVEL